MRIDKVIGIILTFLGATYPFLIYFGLKVSSPRLVALCIGLFLVGGFFSQSHHPYKKRLLVPVVIAGSLCFASALLNRSSVILYLPGVISASLLLFFGYSLLRPPSMVEVFARMVVSDLSEAEMQYCRLVTLIWVYFFCLNGLASFFTACCTSLALWSLYNGLIVYAAMGCLFAVELCYRYWRFRRYAGLPTDIIFRKLFPPRE